jgi:hypothetical protein
VQGTVYWKAFRNSIDVDGIRVIPAGFEFPERKMIRAIAIDFIRAHQNEHGIRSVLATSFKQVERTDSIHVKIVEWALGRQIMAWLSRGVNDQFEPTAANKLIDAASVAYVERHVAKVSALSFEPRPILVSITLWAEEIGPHVVVNSRDGEAKVVKENHGLRTDQAIAARY